MNKEPTILQQFHRFLESGQKNLWLTSDEIEIYIRLTQRILLAGTNRVKCLDVANVSKATVSKVLLMAQTLIVHAEQPNPYYSHIYFENVFNVSLVDILKRNGYVELPKRYRDEPPCLWKAIEPSLKEENGEMASQTG